MGDIFPPLGFEAHPLQQTLLFGLQFDQRRDRRGRSHDRPRLAATERGEPIQAQLERPPLYAAEQTGDVAGQRIIDVADEAQRQMIILRIDPACPRQTATHDGERFTDVPRYFETCEQTGHDTSQGRDSES